MTATDINNPTTNPSTNPVTYQGQQNNRTKSMFLLADSQPLFFHDGQKPFLNQIREQFAVNQPLTAAYIGAANGDRKEYYEIFQLAMDKIGIHECRHITSDLTPQQQTFVEQAKIIVLSGGNVELGWKTLKKLDQQINHAKQNGAVLVGISAGAIHLGQLGWSDKSRLLNNDLFSTFGFAPIIFGAHEENQNWNTLKQVVALTGGLLPGLGIPSGGGVIIHPNHSVQAIRKPAVRILFDNGQLRQGLVNL